MCVNCRQYGGDADDDAQHGQNGAHLVGIDAVERHAKISKKPHRFLSNPICVHLCPSVADQLRRPTPSTVPRA